MTKKLVDSILDNNLSQSNMIFEEIIAKKLKDKLKSKKEYERDNTYQIPADNSGSNQLCSSTDFMSSGVYAAHQTNENNTIQRMKKHIMFAHPHYEREKNLSKLEQLYRKIDKNTKK